MKKSVFLIIGVIIGITLILHCSGGNSPKDSGADDPTPSITELQDTIDALSAKVEALEADNNHGLSQGILGTWNVEYIPEPETYNGTMTFNEDGTYTCTGTLPYTMECDNVSRDYDLYYNLISIKVKEGQFSGTFGEHTVTYNIVIKNDVLYLYLSGTILKGTK